MTQPAKAQEPSMEEILASIRRIIADDDTTSSPSRPADSPGAEAHFPRANQPALKDAELDAMLAKLHAATTHASAVERSAHRQPAADAAELARPVTEPSSGRRSMDAQSDFVLRESSASDPESSPVRPAQEDRPTLPARADREHHLLSATAAAAVDSAFNTLARTAPVQNGRTLEDLVRDTLRPMLKAWLDDNLPGMVERLVRAEIERVSRARS